ncbi:MAG: hypothetical protein WHV66_09280 [Anaerolineales bacterium]
MNNQPYFPSDNEPTVMATPPAQPAETPPPGGFNPEAPYSPEPPKKSRKTLWIVLIIVLVLLCCCCVAVFGYLMYSGGGEFNFDFNLEDMLDSYLPLLAA